MKRLPKTSSVRTGTPLPIRRSIMAQQVRTIPLCIPCIHRRHYPRPAADAGEIIMDMRTFAILPAKTFPNNPTSSLIADPFHEPRHGSHVAYLETSIGPATLVLVRQLRLRQAPDSFAAKHARRGKLDGDLLDEVELSESWRGAVELINGAQETALAEPVDDDGCEVLYGRAGLLYALLLLRSELVVTLSYLAQVGKGKDRVVKEAEALCGDGSLKELVEDIIQRGELGARRYVEELEESEKAKAPPLMWKWHGSRYLGAAHGVGESISSILIAILSSLLHRSRNPAYDHSCPSSHHPTALGQGPPHCRMAAHFAGPTGQLAFQSPHPNSPSLRRCNDQSCRCRARR